MKRIYLFLAIMFTTLIWSQTTTVQTLMIKKALKDTISTRALVIDSISGKVGWAPKSSGGGGGSQDLQSVLDNGGSASTGNNTVELLQGDDNNKHNSLFTSNSDNSIYSSIFNSPEELFINQESEGKVSSITLYDGTIAMHKFISEGNPEGGNSATTIEIDDPTVVSTLKFPAPITAGTYTLATTSDINGFVTLNTPQTITGEKTFTKSSTTSYTIDTYTNIPTTGDPGFIIPGDHVAEWTAYMNSPTAATDLYTITGGSEPNQTFYGSQIASWYPPTLYLGETHINLSGWYPNDWFCSGCTKHTTVYTGGTVNINLPYSKPSGTYTLATTTDINLQAIYDNSNLNATSSLGSVKLLDTANEESRIIANDGTYNNELIINYELASLNASNGTNISQIEAYKNGNISLYASGGIATYNGNEITTVISNSTTSALSSSTLTATYPNATKGLRVQCMSISGAPAIYEKTSTGWATISVTVTP